MKRLREDAAVLDNEIERCMREIDAMESEVKMRKALIAAAEKNFQETKRDLAEVEQEMASLMALDDGPYKNNLEQLGKSNNDGNASTSNAPSAATNAIIGPRENPGAKSSKAFQLQGSKEDLETKKNKVISVGAAASAVRACIVCNVVCTRLFLFLILSIRSTPLWLRNKHKPKFELSF